MATAACQLSCIRNAGFASGLCLGPRLRNSVQRHVQPVAAVARCFAGLNVPSHNEFRVPALTTTTLLKEAHQKSVQACWQDANISVSPCANKYSLAFQNRKQQVCGGSSYAAFRKSAITGTTFPCSQLFGNRLVWGSPYRAEYTRTVRGIATVALAYRPADAQDGGDVSRPQVLKPQVAIFWDLDNKTPDQDPRVVADRVRAVGQHFGQVVDFRAYANRHTFEHIPAYVRQERADRKQVRWEEQQGLRVPDEPYRCGVCGAKCKTVAKLESHFKQLHERERQKKVNRAKGLQKKRPSHANRLFAKLKEKDSRYFEAARDIIAPKSGYRLKSDLKSRGVRVREVKDQSQAADAAILKDLGELLTKQNQIESVVLVSDDSDFGRALERVRASERRVVVVGERGSLNKVADVVYHWWDVHEGLAMSKDYRISQERLDQQLLPPVVAPQEFEEEDDFDYEDFEGHFHDSGEFDYVADDEVDDILFGRAFEDDRVRRRR